MNTQSLYQMPMQGINIILEAVTKNVSWMFWMRSADYKKQLYISEQFTNTFGMPIAKLISNPELFDKFIIDEDYHAYKRIIDNRLQYSDIVQNDFNYYNIVNLHGEIRRICDCSFPIFNRKGQQVAIAGLGGDITTHLKQHDNLPDTSNIMKALMNEVSYALSELNLIAHNSPLAVPEEIIPGKWYTFGEQQLQLSKRQADCMNYALLGKTAKEIARALNLSPRTVEEHLTILKQKLGCSNKMQLISLFAKVLDR